MIDHVKATKGPTRGGHERIIVMATTLITPSFTSLYGQTEVDPLNLEWMMGDFVDEFDGEVVRRLYRDQVEDAIRLVRPEWTLALDGAVYGPQDWQPLDEDEQCDMNILIHNIDVAPIFDAADTTK